jgi:hypothetical protein
MAIQFRGEYGGKAVITVAAPQILSERRREKNTRRKLKTVKKFRILLVSTV